MTRPFPSLKTLIIGIRPKTLTMSLMPILVATSFAFQQDVLLYMEALFAIILGSLSIQIATNLHNDAQDYLNKTDIDSRIGPQRITQSKLATPTQTKNAAYGFFILASLCGLYLIWLGGFIIAVVGLACLLAGYGYSAGPFPISRSPFGEVFVLLFFGVISVATTFYLLSGFWSLDCVILGLCVGTPASAVLLLNNTRDLDNDRLGGRKTLSIVVGEGASKWIYMILMVFPYFIIPIIGNGVYSSWFVFTTVPLLIKTILFFFKTTDKVLLNKGLAMTSACQALMCIALSVGFMLDK
jgi:1,4-dihydroxy-2-naphthoate polyprenyltransferase